MNIYSLRYRAVGLAQLVFFTLTVALMAPVVVIGVSASVVNRAARRLSAAAADLCDLMDLPGFDVRDTFVQLFRRVFT